LLARRETGKIAGIHRDGSMAADGDSITEATVGYWQEVTEAIPSRYSAAPPFRFGYPVRLPCGRYLVLPLRRLPDGKHAVASLIANQASHDVVAVLADHMAAQARDLGGDLVIGLPTLGLSFASMVAARLNQPRYVPFGYSRKFWYDDALSEPVASITSPEAGKMLRLDPNLMSLLAGRRVLIVDDAISTGMTAVASVRLLQRLGIAIAGMVVAMKQTNRWQAPLHKADAALAVRGVYGCPMFRLEPDGCWPLPETQPEVP
jgi:adenine/guanine phosphoribosyltransferase-like PRPP-binding protein